MFISYFPKKTESFNQLTTSPSIHVCLHATAKKKERTNYFSTVYCNFFLNITKLHEYVIRQHKKKTRKWNENMRGECFWWWMPTAHPCVSLTLSIPTKKGQLYNLYNYTKVRRLYCLVVCRKAMRILNSGIVLAFWPSCVFRRGWRMNATAAVVWQVALMAFFLAKTSIVFICICCSSGGFGGVGRAYEERCVLYNVSFCIFPASLQQDNSIVIMAMHCYDIHIMVDIRNLGWKCFVHSAKHCMNEQKNRP